MKLCKDLADTATMETNLGQLLSKYLKLRDISAYQLSQETGISKQTLSGIQNEKHGASPEKVKLIVKALNIPIAELMGAIGYSDLVEVHFELVEQASDPSTPTAELENLAQSEDRDIRQFVAANLSCPSRLLNILSRDPAMIVRRAVAQNARTEPLTLAAMASDPEWKVRRAVAQHNETPMDIKKLLIRDENEEVRTRAKWKLKEQLEKQAGPAPPEASETA